MTDKLLVVVGSGPGIGSVTASLFASQGFNIALLSRNADRLTEDATRVQKESGNSGVKVNTYAVDIADHAGLKSALDKVNQEMGAPEVVLFNAARVAPSEFGDDLVTRLSEDFAVMNIGLYNTATWAVPLLESKVKSDPDSQPCFLMTGGGIWEYPIPFVFALSMQKAAQVNFAKSLSQIVGPKGIHVATVSVNGPVADENEVINAKNVASHFWTLYGQKKDQWESMTDVGERAASN